MMLPSWLPPNAVKASCISRVMAPSLAKASSLDNGVDIYEPYLFFSQLRFNRLSLQLV